MYGPASPSQEPNGCRVQKPQSREEVLLFIFSHQERVQRSIRAHFPQSAYEDVEDAFSTVMESLIRNPDQIPSNFDFGWIYVITRNVLVSHFRKNEIRRASEESSKAIRSSNAQEVSESKEVNDAFNRARELIPRLISQLERPLQQIFWRVVVCQQSNGEAAEQLGVNKAQIGRRLDKLVRELRQKLYEAGIPSVFLTSFEGADWTKPYKKQHSIVGNLQSERRLNGQPHAARLAS